MDALMRWWDFLFTSDYKMTDDFAAAMVTVIPVTLLISVVEFRTFATRSAEHRKEYDQLKEDAVRRITVALEQNTSPDDRDIQIGLGTKAGPGEWLGRMSYVSLAATLVNAIAEIMLITWLGSESRPSIPGLARFITGSAHFGFVSLILGAVSMALDEQSRATMVRENSPLPEDVTGRLSQALDRWTATRRQDGTPAE